MSTVANLDLPLLARDTGAAIARRMGCSADDARAVGCQAARLIDQGKAPELVTARSIQLARSLRALRERANRQTSQEAS